MPSIPPLSENSDAEALVRTTSGLHEGRGSRLSGLGNGSGVAVALIVVGFLGSVVGVLCILIGIHSATDDKLGYLGLAIAVAGLLFGIFWLIIFVCGVKAIYQRPQGSRSST